MSHATMTLPALYDYAKNVHNVDIFDGMTVPSLIDRSTLIDLLMLRSAPFELLYPNVDYMHAAITTWALTHKRTFDKWADALQIAYDPLNNYDRTERFTEVGNEDRGKVFSDDQTATTLDATSTNRAQNDTRTTNGTELTSDQASTRNTGTDTTTNSVSAYDSATWQNSDKSELAHGLNTDTNNNSISSQKTQDAGNENENTNTNSLTSRKINDKSNEKESVNNLRTHTMRTFGNIGVTTSQQMLQAELDVDAWNIYEHIADLFLDEFCVLLY